MSERDDLLNLARMADARGDIETAKAALMRVDAMDKTGQPAQSAAEPLTIGERIIAGMADPIWGGAQLLEGALPTAITDPVNRLNNWIAQNTGLLAELPPGGQRQATIEREQEYQRRLAASGVDGVDWARLGGNIISPANLAVASRLPAATTLGGKMLSGAAGGAGISALSPVTEGDFAEQKMQQIGTGAAFGGVTPAVTSALGRMVSPQASQNPLVSLLRGEGVQPTVGQTLGGRWNVAEEKLMSVPLLGDAIASARGRGLEAFNRAAINRAVRPIGEKVDDIGQEGVRKAGDTISRAYEAAKAKLGGFKIDQQANDELASLRTLVAGLPAREKRQFDAIFNKFHGELSPNGSILADSFKRIDSVLEREAGRFSKSTDAYQQKLGDAMKEMQRILTENAKRANPEAAKAIAQADEAWANLIRIEQAAKSAANNEGVFTPGQLNSAIRMADTSTRGRATARGTALMQDLGTAGQQVIGSRVPNSFTTDRMLMTAGTLGSGFINPAIPIAATGGAALYTPQVQRALVNLLTQRPESAPAIAQAIRQAGPAIAPSAAILGLQGMNQ